MERDSFIFYRSFYEAIKKLKSNDRLAVYDAIASFSLNGECGELKGISEAMFTLIRPQLEANNKKYENGKQPKRQKFTSETEANEKQNISNNQKEANQNDSEHEANNKQSDSKTTANENEECIMKMNNDNVNEKENIPPKSPTGDSWGEDEKELSSKVLEKMTFFENEQIDILFHDFLKLRKNLKAVNSKKAINTLVNALNIHDDRTKYAMITKSMMNSWKGVFDVKSNEIDSLSIEFTIVKKESELKDMDVYGY